MSTLSTSAVHRSLLCVCAYICTIWICTYIYTHLWIYKKSRYVNAEHFNGSQVFVVRECIYMYYMNMYLYIYTFINILKIAPCQRWRRARQRFKGLFCACAHMYVLYEYVRIYINMCKYMKNRAMSTLSTSAVHRSLLCVCKYNLLYEYVRMYIHIYKYIKNRAMSTLSMSAVHRSLMCVCAFICTIWICTYIYVYLNMYVHIYIYENTKNCALSTLSMSAFHRFFLCVCAYICTIWICTYIYTFIHI